MLDFMVCWQGVKPCPRVPQWMGLSLPKGEGSADTSPQERSLKNCVKQVSLARKDFLRQTRFRIKSAEKAEDTFRQVQTRAPPDRLCVALLWALISCRLATPVAAATRECAQNRLDSWREGTPLGQSYCGLVDHGVYMTSVTSSPMTSGDRLFSSAVLLIGGLMIAGG